MQKIIEITESIKAIYNKLCELEIKNQKNSPEYKQNIDYLKIALQVEEQIYNQTNKEELKKLAKTNKRIRNKIDDIEPNMGPMAGQIYSIAASLDDELFTIFFSVLDEKIEEADNKTALCNVKYNNLFTHPDIESFGIANEFKMNSRTNFIFEENKLEISTEEIKKYFLITEFDNFVSQLLVDGYNDQKESDITKMCILKSILILLDEEDIKEQYIRVSKLTKYAIDKETYYDILALFEQTKQNKQKHKVNILKI